MAARGKYRFDERLGGGGMAEVFAGATIGAEGFSRPVAIKRVLPGFSDDPAFAEMFVAEARLTSRLAHPNVVAVLDFDRDDEQRLFLVMELVAGRDLDALAAKGALPYPAIIYAITEVLRGLGYAHEAPLGDAQRGLVHRDVSPHNILLSWEGAVKVSDFGIAKAREASAASASLYIKGKPAYMSPEQASGHALDGRSDLFAVGVILWELLVGRRLFVGADTRATLEAVLFGPIPRPRELRPDVPKDLERVAMKLLERDLHARYRTAELAIADLQACADTASDARDRLVAILGERFGTAPMRKNRAGASVPAHLATTIPNGGSPPHSLGGVRAAPTIAAPRRSAWRLAIFAILVALSGVAAYAIVARGTGSHDAGIAGAPRDAARAEKDATIVPAMHSGSP